MIRPLRRRHLRAVLAVAMVAGPFYLAALAARPRPPVEETVVEALPAPLTAPTPAALGGVEAELPTDPPTRVRTADGGRAVELEATGAIDSPNLLLYWAPEGGTGSVADAWLVGAFRGGERQRFALPVAAIGEPGILLLFSLGHGETVARVDWPAVWGPTP